ncbi:LysM domain-containing protein [Plectosphaerella cucumerina]|uniref:LysM domain-containing protein n=1 Tax=Plectosphaerella cucumerina TaxID=40658 RepID=A0A8K0X416_9PEZI|nr:LysM domain-containing protein [Plectosphaerella cucumerina]
MRSALHLGIALTALVGLGAAQFTVEPPTTAPPDTLKDCTNWHVAAAGDTCADVAAQNFITEAQLYRYNPSLADGCLFVEGTSYCTEENWGIPPPPSTTSTTAAATTTSTGIVTPLPTQPPSIVPGCTRFHFVETGTDCASILSQYGITVAQLYAWNSGVGPTCNGLWSEVYVCVAGPAVASPTTTSATTTANPTSTGANGIVTPSPTQPPSIVSNCNKFDFVQPGNSCNDVLSRNSITLAQLFAWNEGVKADCSGMWASVYLCVGVIGGGAPPTTITTTTRATTTSAGNGITTPTPTQPPSIVSNCNKFYFVEPGTSCTQVLSANGITLAQLFAWNSGVKADCSGMWASVHLCVGVIGGGGTPTTTRVTSTTTRGNGVATPTPTMPDMVTNCNRFYKVVENDTCDVITGKTGVSKANLIAWNKLGASCNVWLGYYLCTRLI